MRKHKHLKMSYNDTRKAIAELQDVVDKLLDIFITEGDTPEIRTMFVDKNKKLLVDFEGDPEGEGG